jgi:hypothetical protein
MSSGHLDYLDKLSAELQVLMLVMADLEGDADADLGSRLSAGLESLTRIVGDVVSDQYTDLPNAADAIQRGVETSVGAAIERHAADGDQRQRMLDRLDLVVKLAMHSLVQRRMG